MGIERRGRSVRKSLRDTYRENNAADKFYASMFGKEPVAQTAVSPKRVIVNRSDASELEASVQKEVAEVLALHSQVVMCVRQNTGAASMVGKGGEVYPVWFYRWIKNPAEMTITDFWGFMRAGPAFVPFAIECKRRDWKPNFNNDRENKQRSFIEFIQRIGGRGGFCTSAEHAVEILAG